MRPNALLSWSLGTLLPRVARVHSGLTSTLCSVQMMLVTEVPPFSVPRASLQTTLHYTYAECLHAVAASTF